VAMSEEKTIIEFKNIVKTYGKDEAKTYALNEVNFSINEGEFIAIMGASGSGKSTSMNIIGCLDNPSSGEYLFNGINVEKLNRNQLALIRKNYIGFVFQGFNLLGRTSALENVELPLIYRRIPAKQRKELAMNALRKVGLESVAHHAPSQLSGGQQQRVAIARALVTNPLIILADEPTGNLDSIKSLEIMDLLKQLNKESNITIIMVTHEEEMASYASRTIYFRDGHIEDSLKKGFK
jgi:putative ABC transport system ATP-binding protein